MGEYSYSTQVHLVLALLGLYNFIRQREGTVDQPVDQDDLNEEDVGDLTPEPITESSQLADNKAMNQFRDQIAQEMWVASCEHIGRDI
jgi:hypothetical protein